MEPHEIHDTHTIQELESMGEKINISKDALDALEMQIVEAENTLNILKGEYDIQERDLNNLKRSEDRLKKILSIIPRS
jgi:septal ring factor EnvC (AmiA/AmiB activator)